MTKTVVAPHQEVARQAAKCGDGRQETGLMSLDGSPARRAARCAERSQFADRNPWYRVDCVTQSEANRSARSRPRGKKPVVPKTGVAPHREVARKAANWVKLPVTTGVMASAPGLEGVTSNDSASVIVRPANG